MKTSISNSGMPTFPQASDSPGSNSATTAAASAGSTAAAPTSDDQLKLTDSALALQEAARPDDTAATGGAEAQGAGRRQLQDRCRPHRRSHAAVRKQAIMQRLEQLDAERQLRCREQPDMATTLEPVCARIVPSLRHCHLLDRRNGSTVNLRLSQVHQALAVLTGHAGESELYGRSGELHASLRSQVLAAT